MWALIVITIVAGSASTHIADFNLSLTDCRAAVVQHENAYCELQLTGG